MIKYKYIKTISAALISAMLITGEVSAHFFHACSSFWHLQYLYYGKIRLWCEGIPEKEKWQ